MSIHCVQPGSVVEVAVDDELLDVVAASLTHCFSSWPAAAISPPKPSLSPSAIGVIPAPLICSSAAIHSSQVVGRCVRVEPRLLDQVEVDDDRVDELVEREDPRLALPERLLRRSGSPSMSAGARTVSFGTVQPFHAGSSDQVPLQLYQRSGPLLDWHAVCWV